MAGVACLIVAGLVPGNAEAAPKKVIRTGGPSDVGDAKRAVVLSRRSLARRRFTVANASGRIVLRGRLRRARGSARPWRHAAVADFSAVATPGSYTVRVPGLKARRRWVVLPPGQAKSRAVRHVLRFFAVNSDGFERSPVHGPSHLNDAIVRGGSLNGQRVDLTGGWMDAGDTMKFTQTISFSTVALLLAARLDAQDADALRASASVGARWLLKAHPAPDVFVSQIGEIKADHDRDPAAGFDPAADDRSSKPAIARRQALTGIGYDSGGRTAAALALVAQLDPDPGRRARTIAVAREWYDAAERRRGLAPRLPENPYPSGSGQDDMALAAIELYRASGEPQDLVDALDWMKGLKPDEPPYWDAVGVLAAAELCGVLGAPAPSPAASGVGCPFVAAAARESARRMRRHALGTAGFLSFGTTAFHGGGGVALALGARAGFAPGSGLAGDARDWVLGRNTWGKSFVAGMGPGAPRRIHHWAVRKGRSAFSGAVVGGPTSLSTLREQRLPYRRRSVDGPAGVYEDKVSNYVTSEVAIDYAASTLLMFAAVGR